MPLAPRWVVGRGLAAGGLVLLLASGGALALDLDRDGDRTLQELRAGTSVWAGDSDGDGLEDGWERAVGMDALAADGDHDSVPDDRELAVGADPTAADTDGDGLSDHDEELLPDCDLDGLRAVAEGDGDADGRLDRLELPGDRCARDAEDDGVPDGAEGNARCVHLTDCDSDGVPDATEAANAGFDPLDPDSFGSGVADGISYVFQQGGQPPGPDADDDGIPDGWEGDDGLVAWGDLRPTPGERDLLVEFLRVQGPDSARYAGLSFQDAYAAVATTLQEERGLRLRYVETVVAVAAETDPELVPRLEDPYYADVLARGQHSGNPFVTTVVLNPQHDQSEVLHAGVAPIRGMLAAVDYGTQVRFTFTSGRGDRLPIEPFLESVVRAREAGSDVAIDGFPTFGIDDGGEMFLVRDDGLQVRWTPSWFRTAPRLVFPSGQAVQLNRTSVEVATGSLAGTILHELGHTLGLCHAHEPDCNARFSADDRAAQATSTMSYDAPANQLHFLGSEWTTVLQYISCPPDAPVTTVAAGGDLQTVMEEKYGYANKDVAAVDLRTCNDFTPLAREFEAGLPPAQAYTPPPRRLDPADDPAGATGPALYATGALLAVAAAAVLAGLWRPAYRS